MTALVIALDLLVSLLCWLIVWQLIRLQPQIVALVVVIDEATISVEQLGLLPTLLADSLSETLRERQQSIQQFRQVYQQPLSVLDQLWQLVRLLLWVRTRR